MRGMTLAFACALDTLVGDPPSLPHPVRAFGSAIAFADRTRPRTASPATDLGAGLALTFALATTAWLAGRVADGAPLVVRAIAGASTLAARSLDDAAADVENALATGTIEEARVRVGRIVGRDTAGLDATGIARATLETLAESLCDGVVAPLVALRIGGCAAAFAFKAISTLDSMIGHIEAPYTFFGRVAARADDVANLIPARIATLAIACAAALHGADARAALHVAWSDGRRHRSPNAGWPEAALAGALGVRLGGHNRYAGHIVRGATFNAAAREPAFADLVRGRRIVRSAGALCALVACAS